MRRARLHLRAREAELRRDALAGGGASRAALGPDPLRLCAVGDRLIGLLRGSSELALLDLELKELGRTQVPEEPLACAPLGHDEVAVIVLAAYEFPPNPRTRGRRRYSSSAAR